MHSSPDSFTAQTQPTQYNIGFHQKDGKLDGQFLGIPSALVPTMLNQLPKHWIAIIYSLPKNEPVSTYSH
jgi:hypothetical protein